MSYPESRARFGEVMDAVVNDRQEGSSPAVDEVAVIVALEDYESLREAAYLMRWLGLRTSCVAGSDGVRCAGRRT